ncbi:GDP-L-fucose synthase [uncultured Desulfosarcina sp.]|uniref:GDP-L-fucose synthase family protein n=1 Tax=uncultured Desulfosarcina sp. TaxID=218289 RepID=UPI0029C7CB9E|nr:GDP-L-fucose synthase [uncultured Desulfosarcina sp.]
MAKHAKIFVAGAAGMVGSAIIRRLLAMGYMNISGSYHSRRPDAATFLKNRDKTKITDAVKLLKVNLTDQAAVNTMFQAERPEYVFIAAAKVGGIQANNTYPAQFIYENLAIQNNLIHAAHQNDVNRLLFLGSSCIYPKLAPQPLKEDHLLTGPLEPTNEPYAIAKIAGIKMCQAYNRQYGTRFMAVMPTNLYGANDNFDLETSHVLPALIRKFHEAKRDGKPAVVVWGSGAPRREFLHVDDMADACVSIINLDENTASDHFFSYPRPCYVNIGSGVDNTIRELAEIIRDVVGFKGTLTFDTSKPDGTPQKLLDVTRLRELGWQSTIGLADGVRMTYQWYREHV